MLYVWSENEFFLYFVDSKSRPDITTVLIFLMIRVITSRRIICEEHEERM
jgi:hypothetical protein